MMEPLNDEQRTTLLDAMGKVERLLQASFVRLEVEDPASVDARWCLEQYFAELNEVFEGGFNRSVVLSAEPHELRPPAGYFIIARVHDRLAGCGGLKLHGSGPAELKRMWVNPAARGLGIGRRLLTELERHASEAERAQFVWRQIERCAKPFSYTADPGMWRLRRSIGSRMRITGSKNGSRRRRPDNG
jgi:GNAT superfamily N-acetyltransferase